MKTSIICFLFFSLLIMKINAQEISEKDNSLLDNYIKSRIAIEKELIVSDTLGKVFSGTFFKVNAGFSFLDGGAMCTGSLLILSEGKLHELDNRRDTMFTLLSLLRKDFYMKSESDIKIFETALDKLFPISWSNEEAREHLRINNKWYFIRGTFFDSKSGYIVTLDQNSRITNIAYDMKAIDK